MATAGRERLRRVTGWSWPRRYPLAQFPNVPLVIGLLAALAARAAQGSVHGELRAVEYMAMTVWAYEEVSAGVNGFRRVIGAGALAYLAASLAGELG